MMIKIPCPLESVEFNVKNMAIMLSHDLKDNDKKGWSHPT